MERERVEQVNQLFRDLHAARRRQRIGWAIALCSLLLIGVTLTGLRVL